VTPFVTALGDNNLGDATANIISIFFHNPFTVQKRLIQKTVVVIMMTYPVLAEGKVRQQIHIPEHLAEVR